MNWAAAGSIHGSSTSSGLCGLYKVGESSSAVDLAQEGVAILQRVVKRTEISQVVERV